MFVNKIKKYVLLILLGLCVLSFSLTACNNSQDINGNNQAEVTGIKLAVFDENNKPICTVSSVTANGDEEISLNEGKRYIAQIAFVQSGGSALASFLADAIVWNYDSEVLVIEKCNNDETDASYYIECKKANISTDLNIQVDDFSLKLAICFKDMNACGHTDKILAVNTCVVNAGYCSDDDLVSGSLNFEKFGNSKQKHLIIYKFDSLTEFTDFKLQYQRRLSFEELTKAVNIIDDSYFADKSLLLVYQFTTDASLRYDVYGVYVDNGTLCVHVEQNDTSDDGIKKKDGWFLALSFEKEYIQDITCFDAILEE